MAQSKRERRAAWKERSSKRAAEVSKKPAKSYKDKSSPTAKKKETPKKSGASKGTRETTAAEDKKAQELGRGATMSKELAEKLYGKDVPKDVKISKKISSPSSISKVSVVKTIASQDIRAQELGKGAKMSPELAKKLYGDKAPGMVKRGEIKVSRKVRKDYTTAQIRKMVSDVAKKDDVRHKGRFDPNIHTHRVDYTGLIPTSQSMVSDLGKQKQLKRLVALQNQPLSALEMTGGTIPVQYETVSFGAPMLDPEKRVIRTSRQKTFNPITGFFGSLAADDVRVGALLPEVEKVEPILKAIPRTPLGYTVSKLSSLDTKEMRVGAYEGLKEKPVTTALTVATFAYPVPKILQIGVGAFKSSRLVATAKTVPVVGRVVKHTPTLAGIGVTGIYGLDVISRVSESKYPSRTLGSIAATELIPMGVGGYLGRTHYAKIGQVSREGRPYKFKKPKEFPLASMNEPPHVFQADLPKFTPRVSVLSESHPEHIFYKGSKVRSVSKSIPEIPEVVPTGRVSVLSESHPEHMLYKKGKKGRLKSFMEEESGTLQLIPKPREVWGEVKPVSQLSQAQYRVARQAQLYREQAFSKTFKGVVSRGRQVPIRSVGRIKIPTVMFPFAIPSIEVPTDIKSRIKDFAVTDQFLQHMQLQDPLSIQREDVPTIFDIPTIQRTSDLLKLDQISINELGNITEAIEDYKPKPDKFKPRPSEFKPIIPIPPIPRLGLPPKRKKKLKGKKRKIESQFGRMSIEHWIGSPEAALAGVVEKMPNMLTIESKPKKRRGLTIVERRHINQLMTV